MRNLIIFYPSLERGGATKILFNLIKFFSLKKINIFLVTNLKDKKLTKIKNLKIVKSKNYNFKIVNKRIISSFSSVITLFKLYKSLNDKEIVILSMQSNFFPTVFSLIFNWKIFIRVSEDPCGATKYADNKFFSYLIFISKFLTYNICYKIIVNSTKSKNCIKKFVFNRKKIILLFNPSLNQLAKSSKNLKKKYFLNVGRFCKQKNQTLLINTFYYFCKKNDEYKLLLCGDGPDKKKLVNQVKALNLVDKVVFLGWKLNLKKYYEKSKLFIHTAYYEGMPNALIESINYELPVLSKYSSGVDDILIGGKGGEIFYKDDPKILAKKISTILLNYKNIINKTKISKKFLSKYLIEKAGQKYINHLCN